MNTEHDERCNREGTRDAIFLFQRRRYQRTDDFPGTEWDGESLRIIDVVDLPRWAWKFADEDGEYINECPELIQESVKRGMESTTGFPLYYETWETDGVWLSREEATDYGNRRSYNYLEGWRVYCVCAEGELGKRLREFGE